MSLFSAIRDTLSGFKSLLVGMRITAREVDARLVPRLDLAALEAAAERGRELDPPLGEALHRRVEEGDAAAAELLRRVHRGLGVLHEVARRDLARRGSALGASR